MLMQCLAVGCGGFLGAIARFLIASLCGRLPTTFPVGTMIINISGSLLLGWFMAIAGRQLVSDSTRLAVAVGFIGAFTTFSTFMYESDTLLRDGETIQAGGNLIGSLIIGLIAIRVGLWLGGE